MVVMPDWLRWSLEWSVIGLPLGIYFLIFGSWQYQLDHPVIVRGNRDLLGLLLGLTGFFLLGPPTWLLHRLRWQGDVWYWIGYAAYVLLLVLLAQWLLKRQQATAIVYAIDPHDAEDTLRQTVQALASESIVVPGRIYWPQQNALLDIRISPLLQTVTLRWLANTITWREKFESALRQELQSKKAKHTLASLWLFLGALLTGQGLFHLLVWALLLWLRS